ncbi:hypothetical protein LINGRAHAP2_LOCUS15591, partial [Linum grandiflorum]
NRRRRPPSQPTAHRLPTLIPPPSQIAGHSRLRPHHHIPGQVLLQRLRPRMIQRRRAPPPLGGIVPPRSSRADLHSDAHRRRRPRPRRRRRAGAGSEPRLRADEERQGGSVHERGRLGAPASGLFLGVVPGQNRVGGCPARRAAERDEVEGRGGCEARNCGRGAR